ncbi:gag [Prosimian retrovirus 1]|nr:gag [Prosimian retrovirus 1]
MGQGLSQHQLYVKQLKDALKTQGVKVKGHDLFEFCDFIEDICPWFSREGTIDIKRWKRVGDALEDFYQTFGPEKVPVTAFAYWNLIKELIDKHRDCPNVMAVIAQAEEILKEGSKTDLRAPPPEEEADLISPESEDEGDHKTQEASRCHDPDWPPPYNTASAPIAMAAVDPKKDLKEKIAQLEEQIKLEELHQSLIIRLQKLRTGNERVPDTRVPQGNIRPPQRPGQHVPVGRPPAAKKEEGFPLADAFPVTETTDPQGQAWRHHTGFDFAVIKELKTAVSQYGATAPYTLAIMESVAENWLTPVDWNTLVRAVLTGGDYLIWKSEYFENCREIAKRNQQAGNGWDFDMLTGSGNYANTNAQMQYDPGLYAQIQATATKAWRKLPVKGDPGASLTGVKQGPDEPFADFVHRLMTTAGRIFGNSEAGVDYVKQLAYENANAACQAAIRPYRKKTDLTGYIRLCSDIGPSYQQGLAMAAAFSGQTVKEFLGNRDRQRRACFKCGKAGHFAKDCKGDSNKAQETKAPGICPRCRKGRHFASECRSKTDIDGNPLPPRSGNGGRGLPQAPKQAYGAVSFVPASNKNPFQTSVEQPQEAQDWTSVPPPTQC